MVSREFPRVLNLLGEASKLLSSLSNGSSNGNANGNQFNDTLSMIQRMLAESSSSRSLARRLNRQERLRSSASPITKPVKEKKKKAFDVSLLMCREEKEEGPYNLTWNSVFPSGMLLLEEDDNEATIRRAIKASLENKFPLISDKDFDISSVSCITHFRKASTSSLSWTVAMFLQLSGIAPETADHWPRSPQED